MKSFRLMMVQLARISQFISQANRSTILMMCALIAVVLGFMAFRDTGILGALRLSRALEQIESDIQRIRKENAYFKKEVEDLRSNRSRIEMEARKLGFMYPDEVAIYLKLDNGATVRAFWRPANTAISAPKVGAGN